MRCLWHQEATASLVQRQDGWHCYGACNKTYSNKEVEEKTGNRYEYEEEDFEKEDLAKTFQYIKALPKKPLRGLEFHSDLKGYYVIWPDESYYKYRLYEGSSKYLSPRGHKPTLLWVRSAGAQTLWIVEGEINAMSLSKVVSGDVCSPGSASVFDTLLKYHLTEFMKYNNINVVVDKDKAGVKALIAARSTFLYKIPFAKYIQLEKDCNDILCEEGQKTLQEKLSRANYQ